MLAGTNYQNAAGEKRRAGGGGRDWELGGGDIRSGHRQQQLTEKHHDYCTGIHLEKTDLEPGQAGGDAKTSNALTAHNVFVLALDDS